MICFFRKKNAFMAFSTIAFWNMSRYDNHVQKNKRYHGTEFNMNKYLYWDFKLH